MISKNKYTALFLLSSLLLSACSGRVKHLDIEGDSDTAPKLSLEKKVSEKFFIGASYTELSGSGKYTIALDDKNEDGNPEEVILSDDKGYQVTITGPANLDQEYTFISTDIYAGMVFLDVNDFSLSGTVRIRRFDRDLTLIDADTNERHISNEDITMHGVSIYPEYKFTHFISGYLHAEILFDNIFSGALGTDTRSTSVGVKLIPVESLELFVEASQFRLYNEDFTSDIDFESTHAAVGLNLKF